jgi:peptidoglycan/LPS O-acetylase OafA/YrhL
MKVHFPNLNAIRFLAAVLVMVHHIELYKEMFNLPNVFHQHNIQLMSKIGVTLFFVLSGFLITHLLLLEQNLTQKINIKSFYMRRILRIWPLYYLIIFSAFFIFPNIDFMHLPGHDNSHWYIKLFFFTFFMPNIIHALGAGLAFGTQTWSIGAEEQFYLIWPWLMKWFKNKLKLVLAVIVIYMLFKSIFYWCYTWHVIFSYLHRIWYLFPIDNMAFGALFAVIHFNQYKKVISFLNQQLVQILTWLLVVILIYSGISLGFLHHQIYSILFGVLIFNLATNPNSIVQFKSTILDYLGKISYGLYMYHSIFIVLSIKCLNSFNSTNNSLLYFLSFTLSIVASAISYGFFEKRFIKMKLKYSTVVSGENVIS